MSHSLSHEELSALRDIARGLKSKRLPPAVAKNIKALTGQKLAAYERKSGVLQITDLGRQTLFMEQCITALRQLQADPTTKVSPDALVFLLRKSHIEQREGEVGHFITAKGVASLADIDGNKPALP